MSADGARRLATIVAVDAAGYSHQSEIDESVAIREITALAERISDLSQKQGGRVFNMAGDGFMLEFSSASGALTFAEDLLASARVPLRIGIHIGEVQEAPGGDLLGRGVNVAARLRELADPGTLRVSGEVKRALPAPGGQRLAARGAVRLSKMDERVETYAIAGTWRDRPIFTLMRGRGPWIAGLAIAILVVGAALAPTLNRGGSERVAVLDFETIGDPSLALFAQGLSSQIVGVMSASDLQAIPPSQSEDFRSDGLGLSARRIGAGFVLDGAVREVEDVLQVNVNLVDAGTNVTLWSNEYRRALDEGPAMQEQLAAHIADVLRCALISRRPRSGEIDPETLGIFLRACDRMQRFDQGPEEMHEAARQVTERAPRFSRGWSMLAMACALASSRVPLDRAEELRAQARDAAERAKSLDRHNAESDLALSLIVPSHNWAERQALIQRALQNEPDSADANIYQGNLLAETGRVREAVDFYRRAVALDPLSPIPWAAMIPTLSATGQFREAVELRDRLHRVWPDSPSVWFNRFNFSVFARQPDAALAILNTVDSAPIVMEEPMRLAWRNYLVAMRNNDHRALRNAVNHIADMARRGEFDMPRAISSSSLAGEVDTGFVLANTYFSQDPTTTGRGPVAGGHRSFLFLRPGAAMRRDVRFMALAKRLGLVDYWIETDRWPDFCADPDLQYDCRAEAARLA